MKILNANELLDDGEFGSMLLRSVTQSHVARTGHSGDMDSSSNLAESSLPMGFVPNPQGREGAPSGAALPMESTANPQGRDDSAGDGEKIRPADPHKLSSNQGGRDGSFGDTVSAVESPESKESASHCRNTAISKETSNGSDKQVTAEYSFSLGLRCFGPSADGAAVRLLPW